AVDVIYQRLRELRCYQPERNISAALPDVAKALDEGQNTAEVIATVYLVVKKGLLEALRNHPQVTWSGFDNPTVKVTEQLIPALERQVAWAEGFFPTIAANTPGWEAWREYVA